MASFLDWEKIFFNDLPITFLGEIVLRSMIMFVIILTTLRMSGKRGIKQFSVFELVLIIGLGSAAGDPMLYEDVGIVHALTVFIVIIILYTIVTALTDRVKWIERLLEGKPVYVIENGSIILESFKKTGLSKDEFFGGLRVENVEHLGQVKTAIIENTGDLSLIYYPNEDVQPGLPIFPALLEKKTSSILHNDYYACYQCGRIKSLSPGKNCCSSCECKEWVKTIKTLRIS